MEGVLLIGLLTMVTGSGIALVSHNDGLTAEQSHKRQRCGFYVFFIGSLLTIAVFGTWLKPA